MTAHRLTRAFPVGDGAFQHGPVEAQARQAVTLAPWLRIRCGRRLHRVGAPSSYARHMTENEIQLKAIAALTALRGGVGTDYVSDLLGEVIPTQFLVPATEDAAEVSLAVLSQLSEPLSALINGFVLAFETVADAYDRTAPEAPTDAILQALALDIARDSD